MSLIDNTTQSTSVNTTQNQTSNQLQSGSQSQNGTQQQASNFQYNQGQQALQGQLGAIGSQLLSGNVSQSFGMPQSVADWAMYQFEKNQAPRLAHQFGGGTNLIGANRNELIANLAARSAEMAVPNALNAFNSVAGYATRPMGEYSSGSNSMLGTSQNRLNSSMNGTTNQSIFGTSTTTDLGGIANQVGYGYGAGYI